MSAVLMLAIGAGCALLLALAVTLAHRRPLPKRSGFEVVYEHVPVRAK